MTISVNSSESMVSITCPKCSGTFDINRNSANAQGNYNIRCPFCRNRIIRQTTIKVGDSPAPNIPQTESIPIQFSSIQTYLEWQAGIASTIAKIKKSFYPFVRFKSLETGDLGVPPSCNLFNPFSWWLRYHSWLTKLAPPILIKPHRLLLENQLALINQYLDVAPLDVQFSMKDDRDRINQIFSLMEKARDKLRDKFPELPIEYEAMPRGNIAGVLYAVLMMSFIIVPFVSGWISIKHVSGLDLPAVITFLPQMLVPGFTRMADISNSPDAILLHLSICFYYMLLFSCVTYYFPNLRLDNSSKKYKQYFYIIAAISLVSIVTLYFAPFPWFSIFYGASSHREWLIFLGSFFVTIAVGETLGATLYMIKNRLIQKHLMERTNSCQVIL